MSSIDNAESEEKKSDFVRSMIEADLAKGKYDRAVATRFPPEPNGYLHIGHAKSICLNFGIAEEFAGAVCHLRFDDTNPATEDPEFVESIQHDIHWLGFDWGDRLFFASDYFDRFYDWARELVGTGKAYVDSQSEAEIRAARGTVTESGTDSPHRERSPQENLDLLERMRAGEFEDGTHVLRAKIDMSAANMKMRDPLLYRIRKAPHYRCGDRWNIYPMYDFAHCLSDSVERITHSLCTLEFENNRDIYDWVLENVTIESPRPEQTEFARLSINYTVLSKRKLLELVRDGHVSGWNDPRMPTLSGLRRRGYTPEAIRHFCNDIGVAKANSTVDIGQLEHAIRADLNHRAPRVLAVLRPLKLVIENYPADSHEELEAPYFPHDIGTPGSRKLPFGRQLLIERDDFAEEPPPKFHRLAPGREVRLRYAYLVRCTEVIKDPSTGEVVEVRCTYDPETRGGSAPDGRKVKGTIHWVDAERSRPAEVRLYDRLFADEQPDRGKGGPDFKSFLNPSSLEVLTEARVEQSLAQAEPAQHFQFERQGYFFTDPEESTADRLVFNRVVTLRESWRAPVREVSTSGPAAGKGKTRRPPRDASPAPKKRELSPAAAALSERLRQQHSLAGAEADLLAERPELSELFERAVQSVSSPSALAKFVLNDLLRELKSRSLSDLELSPEHLAELVDLGHGGTISAPAMRKVFAALLETGDSPSEIVARLGLVQIQDDERLRPMVVEVVIAHADEVQAYREGRESLFGFFVGQVMKASRGKADPRRVNELLREVLAE